MQLTITPLIKQTFTTVLTLPKQKLGENREVFAEYSKKNEGDGVDLEILQQLLESAKMVDGSPQYLHELLKGSKPYHYIAPPPPRNPELEKRCQQLKADLENKQYRKMVRGIVEPPNIRRIKNSMELKDSTSQAGIGLNIIVTMATTMALGWVAGQVFFQDNVVAMCLAILFCICGMLVDMWLFVINTSSLDKHVQKQEKSRKRQSVLLPNYQGLVKYD